MRRLSGPFVWNSSWRVLASATDVSTLLAISVTTRVGGVLLTCSLVTGVFAYGTNRPDAGPDPRAVHDLAASKANTTAWYLRLIDGYCEAIDYKEMVIDTNARYLFWTQLFFVAGVVTIAGGLPAST